MRILFLACLLANSAMPSSVLVAQETPKADGSHTSTVGMPARLEQIVLPGSELVAKPIESQPAVVLRIVESWPHGSDFRYDIEYYGLEPGTWNLSDFLERKDGSATDGLPVVNVEIKTLLPPGQVEPGPLEADTVRGLGGYQIALILGGIVWGAGLVAILFAGRGKANTGEASGPVPTSLADRLRPVVQQAIAGNLSNARLAELELMLVAFWRKRLGIEQADAAEVIPRLRTHAEAGPLLRQLEVWLHQPRSSGRDVNVAGLLEPYRNLPADALDEA